MAWSLPILSNIPEFRFAKLMASEDTHDGSWAERGLIFVLLCLMVLYLAKALWSFRTGGYTLHRGRNNVGTVLEDPEEEDDHDD